MPVRIIFPLQSTGDDRLPADAPVLGRKNCTPTFWARLLHHPTPRTDKLRSAQMQRFLEHFRIQP